MDKKKNQFNPDEAFKNIIKVDLERIENPKNILKGGRVQRSYWIDKELDRALKLKAFLDETNLTETINSALREALSDYLK